MKILLVTDNHNPHGGGAEKYFFTLKKCLEQTLGFSVMSLGFGPETQITADTVVLRASTNKVLQLVSRLLFSPWHYWQMRRQIKKYQPDVIHLHNYKKHSFALFAALRGYPIVHTVHDFTPICPTYWNVHSDLQPCATGFSTECWQQHKRDHSWPMYFILLIWFFCVRKWLKSSVHAFIAPSPLLAHYLTQQGFTPVQYISHYQNRPAQPHHDPLRTEHFLFLGQLGKHKGTDILLREFALARQKNPNLFLSIAGTGKEEMHLRQQAQDLGLNQHVAFLGWVADTQKLLLNSCALILPSIWLEAFGLVTVEAMSYSRPVIGSNRGPTPWLVADGKNGLLFDPLKPGDLAEKILQLAGNETLIRKLGKNGYQRLEQLPTQEIVVQKIVKVYKAVCAK